MIKFFRKIRQKMLNENKLGKYLLYAVGEIVLVVIGILIALSLNNWNQTQGEIAQENLSLNNLLLDLEEQSSLLDEYIRDEFTYQQDGQAAVELFISDGAFTQIDSLIPRIASINIRRTFNPINTTFQELNSSGNIGLIRNDSIKRELIEYYHELERVTLVVGNNNRDLIDAIMVPVFLQYVPYERSLDYENFQKQYGSTQAYDFPEDLKAVSRQNLVDPEKAFQLLNIIRFRSDIARGHADHYIRLKQETKDLIVAIKRELVLVR